MKTNARKMSTQKMVLAAILTAIVVVLQLLAQYTTFFGPFSTAVALIPIVIGAAMCGLGVGAWLGFVFSIVVLLSGGANLFLAVDVPGTIVTVITKGTACGLASAVAYLGLQKLHANRVLSVLAAAIVCPVVNTGVFMLGCMVFFMDDVSVLANMLGSSSTGVALFWALAMGNFLFELGMNIVLSPAIVRILHAKNKE